MMLLGDCAHSSLSHTLFKTIKIKTYVKILGIHFTYDYRIKQKLNFDELITSIKNKLRIWKWRDLTIIGRIQIVQTFIIPIFLYRASMICLALLFHKIIFERSGLVGFCKLPCFAAEHSAKYLSHSS